MPEDNIREFAGYLLEGNERQAWAFLDRNRFRSRREVFENILTPSMRYVGELWENNEITVADEHVATGVCDFLMSRLYPQAELVSAFERKKAMFLCVKGEMHYLGLKMVNMLFEEDGWDTLYFGPNLPLEYALKKAEDWTPDIVGLSVSIVYNLPQVKEYVKAFSSLANPPKILLGGRMAGKYGSADATTGLELIENLDSLETWLKVHRIGGRENAVQS